MKTTSKVHKCHVLTGNIPQGAFWRIGDNVYAASPELLFVEMATRLPFIDLILLGLELCGTYTLRADGAFGFENCPAATTRKQLASFTERAKGMRGATTARSALRWVIDGAHSPMESALMLFLCLPVRLGGYAFPFPDLNPEVKLGIRAAHMLGQDDIRCDLHWLKKHVVVEYNSTDVHLNPHTAAKDALRSNTLQYKDHTVISVTPYMIANHVQFDGVARQLGKALGVRIDSRKLLYSKARRELRVQLFPWLTTRFRFS